MRGLKLTLCLVLGSCLLASGQYNYEKCTKATLARSMNNILDTIDPHYATVPKLISLDYDRSFGWPPKASPEKRLEVRDWTSYEAIRVVSAWVHANPRNFGSMAQFAASKVVSTCHRLIGQFGDCVGLLQKGYFPSERLNSNALRVLEATKMCQGALDNRLSFEQAIEKAWF